MGPRVTVGLCIRNCEEFIRETIESILNQDFPHELMELIFVDDGSEDDTLFIVRDYASKVDISTRVFHTAWKGLGNARNLLLTHAQGEYVLWVDGDMILSKDFIRKLLEFMDEHPKVGIAKGKQSLEPGGNLLASLETYSRAAGRMVDYQSEKARSKALGTGGSIYRLHAIRQVGGFDENLRGYGEDWDTEIRIKAAGWLLSSIDTEFLDYERHRVSWRSLWRRYWLRGYYTHYFLHKNPGLIRKYRMLPPAAFLNGLLYSGKLFGLTHRKSVFLLPFQHLFKMSAWCFGFTRSHTDAYAPY